MAKLRFHIRYPEEKIPEPILYEIGHEYKVIPSIRRADVRETTGWMDVEFSGETAIDQIKRSFEELVEFLFREDEFPQGALLMTGTGIVPGTDFTLASGDEVSIEIAGLGQLVNSVE